MKDNKIILLGKRLRPNTGKSLVLIPKHTVILPHPDLLKCSLKYYLKASANITFVIKSPYAVLLSHKLNFNQRRQQRTCLHLQFLLYCQDVVLSPTATLQKQQFHKHDRLIVSFPFHSLSFTLIIMNSTRCSCLLPNTEFRKQNETNKGKGNTNCVVPLQMSQDIVFSEFVSCSSLHSYPVQ